MSHSPPGMVDAPDSKRPKGILKNHSFQGSPPSTNAPFPIPDAVILEDPAAEKDLTIQNTLQNAGRRRSSSMNDRKDSTTSRRQSMASRSNSHTSQSANVDPEASPQLKWDEANLYLNEQQKSSTMKITEPKTPYAKHYNPMEDEAELRMLDAEQIDVDELDMKKNNDGTECKKKERDDDIPGLDIGAPEEDINNTQSSLENDRVDRKVVLEDDGHHGGDVSDSDDENSEKHKMFAAMRRRHYEMKDVKDLLGHPEDVLNDEDDDGDIALGDGPSESLPNGKM